MINNYTGIMIATKTLETMFPGCEYDNRYDNILIIPNQIIIPFFLNNHGTLYIFHYPAQIDVDTWIKWDKRDVLLKIDVKYVSALVKIFKLIKNKTIIYDYDHTPTCMIENQIHYQFECKKWIVYRNIVCKNDHIVHKLMDNGTRRAAIFSMQYGSAHDKFDTNTILHMKICLLHYHIDVKFKYQK
jgi:hypothetical protein